MVWRPTKGGQRIIDSPRVQFSLQRSTTNINNTNIYWQVRMKFMSKGIKRKRSKRRTDRQMDIYQEKDKE